MRSKKRGLLKIAVCLSLIITILVGNQGVSAKDTKSSSKNEIRMVLGQKSMVVNGVEQEIDTGRDTKAISINGRTMIPIRAVVEAMGGYVLWDKNKQRVGLICNGKVIELFIETGVMLVDDTPYDIDVKPVIKNGRTLVPVRHIVEAFGGEIAWEASSKTVSISGYETVDKTMFYESLTHITNDPDYVLSTAKWIQSSAPTFIDETMSEEEKFIKSYEFIADYFEYERGNGLVEAVVLHKTQCMGYAMYLDVLLNYIGVESKTITGYTMDIIEHPYEYYKNSPSHQDYLHMWNIVKIDGKYYHSDPTFEDGRSYVNGVVQDAFLDYRYILMSDDCIKDDHIWDEATIETNAVTEYDKLGMVSKYASNKNYYTGTVELDKGVAPEGGILLRVSARSRLQNEKGIYNSYTTIVLIPEGKSEAQYVLLINPDRMDKLYSINANVARTLDIPSQDITRENYVQKCVSTLSFEEGFISVVGNVGPDFTLLTKDNKMSATIILQESWLGDEDIRVSIQVSEAFRTPEMRPDAIGIGNTEHEYITVSKDSGIEVPFSMFINDNDAEYIIRINVRKNGEDLFTGYYSKAGFTPKGKNSQMIFFDGVSEMDGIVIDLN